MNKKLRMRVWGAILVASIGASCFVGCNSSEQVTQNNSPTESKTEKTSSKESTPKQEVATKQGNQVNPPGEFPIVDEPITLSVFIKQLPYVGDLNDNKFIEYMEEKTNITLDMLVVPNESLLEKQKLLLASNNYPEVFLSGSFSNADVMQLGVDEKILMPIGDLLQEYSPEIKELWETQKQLQADMTAPDGNIYVIPTPQGGLISEYVHRKLWVNQNWLDQLGLEKPSNIEEFTNMLRAFKEQDPNGNGKKDEIPLSGAIGTWAAEPEWFIMNAFVECEPYSNFFFINEQEQLVFAPRTDEWKQGLTYIKQLYDEGLLDPASFTQDQSQLGQIGNNPENIILGSYAAGHLGMAVDINSKSPDQRHREYTGLPIFEGPNGRRAVPVRNTERKDGGNFVVTDKCKNPEAAIRLADYILSEEGYLYGDAGLPEAEAWRAANPGELNIYGEQAKYSKTPDSTKEVDLNQRVYSWSGTSILNQAKRNMGIFSVNQNIYEDDGYTVRMYQEFMENCEPFMSKTTEVPPVWINAEEGTKFAQITAPLIDFVKASAAEFITGKKSLDDWEAYLKELDNLKYQEWFTMYEKAVNERLNK